jgi:hypothetical protein
MKFLERIWKLEFCVDRCRCGAGTRWWSRWRLGMLRDANARGPCRGWSYYPQSVTSENGARYIRSLGIGTAIEK